VRGGQRPPLDRRCRLSAASRREAQSRGQMRSAIATDPVPREMRTAFAHQRGYPATVPGRHLPMMPVPTKRDAPVEVGVASTRVVCGL
jgi:hypothetical protein